MTSFADFEDDVRASNDPYRRRGCGVGALLKTLGEADAQRVNAVLSDETITSPAIYAALKRRVENAPSSYTINRHRRGTCQCDETR